MDLEDVSVVPLQRYFNSTGVYSNITTTIANNEASVVGKNPYILPWWQQLLFIIPFVAMFIVAVVGNFIVIWIVLAHKRMRTVTNYFLVNLAIADGLMSVLNTLFNTVYLLYANWPFGADYCKFSMFISPCTISASVFTFVAIALDRYMAIIHPLKPRWPEHVVIFIINAIWVTSIGISLPNLLYATTYTFHYTDGLPRTVCILDWPDGVYKTMDFIYSIVLLVLNYFLPMTILAIAYIIVGIYLWHSRSIGEKTPRQIESIKSKRKVVKMLIIVVVIFGICWLPMHVYFLLTNIYPSIINYKYIQQFYLIIYWMAMSNSMYNPIIYCWMNTRFRKGFKYVFRWCPFVTWEPKDNLVHITGTTVRQSWGGNESKLERNGSTMHTTVDDSFDETTYYSWSQGHQRQTRDGGYNGIDESSM